MITIDDPFIRRAFAPLSWSHDVTAEGWTVRAPAGDHWLEHLRRSTAPGGHRVAVGDLMARLVPRLDTATLRLYTVTATRGSTTAWVSNGYGAPPSIEITARLQLAAWCDYGQRGRFAADYYVPIERLRGFAPLAELGAHLEPLAADYHAAATREVTP
jgi:hypothetical protein